jgi:hypothetical protein
VNPSHCGWANNKNQRPSGIAEIKNGGEITHKEEEKENEDMNGEKSH